MRIYKTRTKKILGLLLLFSMVFGLTGVNAQHKKTNISSKISYRVISNAFYPIQGESNFLNAEIELNDDTKELERIDFEVPVNSFMGFNSEYLQWVGGFGSQNLRFKGNKVEKIDDKNYRIIGNLNFRNISSPLEIQMQKRDSSNQFILSGNFNLRVRDFFIGHYVSRRLVPSWIPFKVTLAFNKNDINEAS